MKIEINRKTIAIAAATVLFLGVTAGSCDSDDNSGASKENTSRNKNQDELIAKQPAHKVRFSPGRDTKNKWIDTWGQEEGKLAYVYIQNANGEYGYFVFVGPPVSYCDSLVPPYTKTGLDLGGNGGQAIVPAPGMDGLYHSAANCNTYYGIDGVTGAYVEFSVGMNQSYMLFSEPQSLPQYRDAQQMGPASIAKAKQKEKSGS